jgi:hypothetical protein
MCRSSAPRQRSVQWWDTKTGTTTPKWGLSADRDDQSIEMVGNVLIKASRINRIDDGVSVFWNTIFTRVRAVSNRIARRSAASGGVALAPGLY